MMNCLEFRRRVGAEPALADGGIEAHRRECPACARYQDELRAMDTLIGRALAVDASRIRKPEPAIMPAGSKRQDTRFLAIAASIVIGLAVGLTLWVSSPRPSLAREVIGHVAHEPEAMNSPTPIEPGAFAGVLDPEGTKLRAGIGSVSFAARCVYEGHVVPHLVVRMPQGTVTVLLLRHRSVGAPVRIAEQGYEGIVLPAPRGSIAIVGRDQRDLSAIAQQVFEAVDWGD
ncbi:MAG: DUF3379 family protein [Steroidobacteraceae bacterium]